MKHAIQTLTFAGALLATVAHAEKPIEEMIAETVATMSRDQLALIGVAYECGRQNALITITGSQSPDRPSCQAIAKITNEVVERGRRE